MVVLAGIMANSMNKNDIRLKAKLDLISALELEHEVSKKKLAKQLNVTSNLSNNYSGYVLICDAHNPQATIDKLSYNAESCWVFYPNEFCILDDKSAQKSHNVIA